jgi:hypothetical protein
MSTVDVCKTEKPSSTTTSISSPWARVAIPESAVYSLEDVMSEQLAKDLQEKEDFDLLKQENLILEKLGVATELTPSSAASIDKPNDEAIVDSDYLVAQLLQLEMDKEYDEALKNKEIFTNKNSRGKLKKRASLL